MSVWQCSVCGSTETKKRAKGMCHSCYLKAYREQHYGTYINKRREEYQRNYAKHRDKIIARTTERNRQTKRDVIAALGGKCACCGEAAYEFLTLDHINGDGAAHRKLLSGKARSSSIRIYRDVKRRGCPTDQFRVLCFNCNCSIGCWGYCPHQRSNAA